jgi:hypothetical protein
VAKLRSSGCRAGGILGPGPLAAYAGRFAVAACFATLGAMLPGLYAPALVWHRFERAHPREAPVAVASSRSGSSTSSSPGPW